MPLPLLALGGLALGAGSAFMSYRASQESGTARNTSSELASLPYSQQRKNARKFALDQLTLQNLFGSQVRSEYGDNEATRRAQQVEQSKTALSLLPKFASAERRQTSNQRAGDLRDYERLRASSPGVASLDRIGGQAGDSSLLLKLLNLDSGDRLGGRSDLNAELESQALGDLRLGGQLTEQEQRDAEQAARGAWASRGLAYSPGAVGAEILGRDSATRARRDSRRSFAGGVSNLILSEDEQLRRYAMGVEQLNDTDLSTRASVATTASAPLLNSFAQRTGAFNPTLTAMGLTGTPGETSGVLNQAPSIFQGAAALTPLYNYGADAFNTNLNASASRSAARSNLFSSLGGAAIGAAGQIGAAHYNSK